MGNTDLILQWSKLISLTEDQVDKLPQDIEGAFRISKKEGDDRFYVVFIGSSTDLKKELKKLIAEKKTNFLEHNGEFSFRYAPVKGVEIRKAIEKQLYRQYAPEYNSKEPESSLDVKANLN
ncbi:MAG: hypothetical protein V4519_01185 [Patescibacteria group bacterium]